MESILADIADSESHFRTEVAMRVVETARPYFLADEFARDPFGQRTSKGNEHWYSLMWGRETLSSLCCIRAQDHRVKMELKHFEPEYPLKSVFTKSIRSNARWGEEDYVVELLKAYYSYLLLRGFALEFSYVADSKRSFFEVLGHRQCLESMELGEAKLTPMVFDMRDVDYLSAIGSPLIC